MPIEIKITGETPEELNSWLARLGGPTSLVYEHPRTAAAPKARTTKSEKPAEPAGSAPVETATVPSTSETATTGSVGPTATTPATSSETTSVAEADLIAAANAAAGTLGPSAAAKIRTYIGGKFTKIDGTPGTLKSTRPEQQAALLADLQKIARKELAL